MHWKQYLTLGTPMVQWRHQNWHRDISFWRNHYSGKSCKRYHKSISNFFWVMLYKMPASQKELHFGKMLLYVVIILFLSDTEKFNPQKGTKKHTHTHTHTRAHSACQTKQQDSLRLWCYIALKIFSPPVQKSWMWLSLMRDFTVCPHRVSLCI